MVTDKNLAQSDFIVKKRLLLFLVTWLSQANYGPQTRREPHSGNISHCFIACDALCDLVPFAQF